MPARKKQGKKSYKRRNNAAKRKGRKSYRYSTPVLKLRTHAQVDVDFQGQLVSQFNIVPQLAAFPQAVAQAAFYQSYRITNVKVHFVPSNNVNSTSGNGFSNELVHVYHCPLRNNKIPLATVPDYLQYASCKVQTYDHHLRNSFQPLVPSLDLQNFPQLAQQATYQKSPTLSCDNLTSLHFGHTYLFVRRGQNLSQFYSITAIITLQVEFYNYDGQLNVQVPFKQIHQLNKKMYKMDNLRDNKVLKSSPQRMDIQQDKMQQQTPQMNQALLMKDPRKRIIQLIGQSQQQQQWIPQPTSKSLSNSTTPLLDAHFKKHCDPIILKMLQDNVPNYKQRLRDIMKMVNRDN